MPNHLSAAIRLEPTGCAYAQQPSATEPTEESAEGFVKLEMPLEEALTKITFIVIQV